MDARLLRRGLLDNGYAELSITSEHAINTDQLAHTHNDPFDRILLAQAMVEGITLVTNVRGDGAGATFSKSLFLLGYSAAALAEE